MSPSESRKSDEQGHRRLRGTLDGPSKTITVEPIQIPVPPQPQRVDSPDPARGPDRPRQPERPREPAR
jgi:hypothetical protein